MPETSQRERDAARAPVPPLSPRLTDLRPIAYLGIGSWLVAFLVLLIIGERGDWFWVTLYGAVFGILFFGISEWQRSAARRGSRSAQTGFHMPNGPRCGVAGYSRAQPSSAPGPGSRSNDSTR